MTRFENQCVNCGMLPCLGSSCPNRNVRVLNCDDCGQAADKLYVLNGDEICERCLLKGLEVIE
ncbi:MAG: hypothetical protein UD936_01980 [Acutalibacteraceae bacterium]|nr:hypothetical protein [Acutalibacteraceae bacterium]